MVLDSKLPYPKSVFFIIVNEFCERFSYYGMKTVLILYLKNILLYSEDSASVLYHAFSGLCYFTPLFGAMIADSLLGKFKTIFYLSIVYACGNIILSMGATGPLNLPQNAVSILGLFLIAVGTGGIKPCVSAFGGDQFKLPEQEKQMSTFFSIFYFSINAGSLISSFLTPILREDVHCFGANSCFPLAFSVPAVLMVTALVIFVIGKPWYVIREAEGNIVVRVSKCVTHAVRTKWSSKACRDHWLDYADDIYDTKLISDIKVLFRVLVLYIPLPVFWSLFEQTGSRWTLQATRMNGETFDMFLIKPDQMGVINPFLVLALIPLFDQVIYPGLAKFNLLKKSLQRLTFGGILTGLAFIVAGIVELNLEPTYAVKLGATESHLNFINSSPCHLNFRISSELNSTSIKSLENAIFPVVKAGNYSGYIFDESSTKECLNYESFSFEFTADPKEARTYIISIENGTAKVTRDNTPDALEKSRSGNPQLKMLVNENIEDNELNSSLVLIDITAHTDPYRLNLISNASRTFELNPGMYRMELVTPANETLIRVQNFVNVSGMVKVKLGGNYVFNILRDEKTGALSGKAYTITQPNSVHMLWLLPQYIILTIAEVMFSITGLEFSFSQAPTSMKSVLQAAWLVTIALGNLVYVVVAKSYHFEKQSNEFFWYAGFMFMDLVLFGVLAYFYKPSNPTQNEKEAHK